jgi:hypothetical protein
MLKKEFKRKDVERLRNLIKGNTNDSAETQIGYTKKVELYQEGDVWEENGKKWTIKDGIKQSHTKLDQIKKEVFTPLFCPECSNIMKKRMDSKMYKIHKKCFDCVIEMEHKLKLEGKYDEYEKNLVAHNALSYANDLEQYLLEAINTSNNQYVSENGEVERWKGGIDKEKLTQEVKDGIEEFKKDVNNYINKND